MIASSLTCRVLRAVWLWLAALGQSSRVFGAIGRCYRASGTHRTLARWLGTEPRALASSRYTRAFTNENAPFPQNKAPRRHRILRALPHLPRGAPLRAE